MGFGFVLFFCLIWFDLFLTKPVSFGWDFFVLSLWNQNQTKPNIFLNILIDLIIFFIVQFFRLFFLFNQFVGFFTHSYHETIKK